MFFAQRTTLALLLALPLCGWLGVAGAATPAAAELKITVYGGTGNIGQRIVAEALRRGHQVTVVARDPSKLSLKEPGLAAARGDVLDTADVARLATGQDVVISAINNGRGGASEGNDFLVRAAKSLVGALETLGPRAPRLLVVGGAGSLEVAPGVTMIDQMRQAGGAGAAMINAGGGPVEQKLALDYYRTVSDVNWSYFSPAMRIEPGKRTGVFRLGGDQIVKDAKGDSRISIEDYAVAMIDEVEKPSHSHQRFTIGY